MSSSGKKIRVFIVDDSPFYRQAVSELLRMNKKFEVIGAVQDGGEAIRFVGKNAPDVILLDLEMPRMDGFTFLRWLMGNHPLPVVVLSSRTETSNVFKALEIGAVDFLAKPRELSSFTMLKLEHDVITKTETAASVSISKLRTRVLPSGPPIDAGRGPGKRPRAAKSGAYRALAIGASTGGPPAVQQIVTQLPKDLELIVLVAQHMPKGFTVHFAERLNRAAQFRVKEPESGEQLEPGTVYIAPGGCHLSVEGSPSRSVARLIEREPTDKFAPSVDILMESMSEIYRERSLGVLLTGMGADGAAGLLKMRKKGGFTIAESEESAVVFGMPREAIERGGAEKILPLDAIAGALIDLCS